MKNIAIFASGSGTNAENLATYFSTEKCARVALILSNNADAFVLERARKLGIESVVFDREQFWAPDGVLKRLRESGIDFIVLAGFLWLVPPSITSAYSGKIVNIHPALLPGFGGKGMYGDRVHRAVIESGERESGITIHYVNEKYDEGDVIMQARCPVEPGDTAATLAARIHGLEYAHFPAAVKKLILELP